MLSAYAKRNRFRRKLVEREFYIITGWLGLLTIQSLTFYSQEADFFVHVVEAYRIGKDKDSGPDVLLNLYGKVRSNNDSSSIHAYSEQLRSPIYLPYGGLYK